MITETLLGFSLLQLQFHRSASLLNVSRTHLEGSPVGEVPTFILRLPKVDLWPSITQDPSPIMDQRMAGAEAPLLGKRETKTLTLRYFSPHKREQREIILNMFFCHFSKVNIRPLIWPHLSFCVIFVSAPPPFVGPWWRLHGWRAQRRLHLHEAWGGAPFLLGGGWLAAAGAQPRAEIWVRSSWIQKSHRPRYLRGLQSSTQFHPLLRSNFSEWHL